MENNRHTNKPDILIFLSDQHNAMYTGYAGHNLVKTPHLDTLASDGTVFDAAYTSCPLCVPARVSMLTGQLPSKTGVFTNNGAIAVDQATFIHAIAAEGYETVLCGRMHFMGSDQRHGFTKRIMKEITPLYWGRGGRGREDLGPYVETFSPKRCLDVIGGGTSPVLEYDRDVISAAINYLEQDHEKPQCIVIGTYAPHFSYVAPPELYNKYRADVELPETLMSEYDIKHPLHEPRKKRVSEEIVLDARAAYMGMITHLDEQIGAVRDAWKKYLNQQNHKGVFIYLSDHGDQIGERDLYGKQTFYEGSARIPLVIEGDGILGNKRMNGPVSIMDIGPTLCELIEATVLPRQDGRSLVTQLKDGEDDLTRHVLSEFVEIDQQQQVVCSRMIRHGVWKYITYNGYESYDMLFNLEADSGEIHNHVSGNPKITNDLSKILNNHWDIPGIITRYEEKSQHFRILAKWGSQVDVEEEERWVVPIRAHQLPL